MLETMKIKKSIVHPCLCERAIADRTATDGGVARPFYLICPPRIYVIRSRMPGIDDRRKIIQISLAHRRNTGLSSPPSLSANVVVYVRARVPTRVQACTYAERVSARVAYHVHDGMRRLGRTGNGTCPAFIGFVLLLGLPSNAPLISQAFYDSSFGERITVPVVTNGAIFSAVSLDRIWTNRCSIEFHFLKDDFLIKNIIIASLVADPVIGIF